MCTICLWTRFITLRAGFCFQAEDGIRVHCVPGVQTFAFFFSSRRRHTRSLCDWSSDVCSSDLIFFLVGFMASYMTVLSWADYSYVMPVGAFGYAMLTFFAVVVLHEHEIGRASCRERV